MGHLDIGPSFKFNDDLSIQIDGAAQEFISLFKFRTGTTRVQYNGQRLTLGVDYDEVGDTTIKFVTRVPVSGRKLTMDYERKI